MILLLGDDHVRATLALEVGERSAGLAVPKPHENVQTPAAGGAGARFSLRRCHSIKNTRRGKSLRNGPMPPAHGAGGSAVLRCGGGWRALRDSNPCRRRERAV